MYQLTTRWGLINKEVTTSFNTLTAARERGHYLTTGHGALCHITHPDGRVEDIDWLTRRSS